MLKDVTLGQFFPGSSIVHRLDPRCKLLLTIVYIAALFTAESYVSYAVMLVITGVCIALSRIQLKVILRGLKPLWVIIALTAVLNMFFTPGRELVSFWKITITYEGLIRAVFMVLRITMLIAGTFLLTYTTSPIALTDAIAPDVKIIALTGERDDNTTTALARAYVEKLKARNINASFLPLANETHNSAFRSPEVFNAVRSILQ